MSSPRQDGELPKLRWPDEIDEIFGRANPNPTRQGCPPRDELIALARKQRQMSDPGYVHLTGCSPCYLEVRALQEDARIQRRRTWFRMAAAAVLVIGLVLGAWFALNRLGPVTDIQAQLDLRPYARTRSDVPDERQPLTLPRGRLTLNVILPVGFDPGTYDVQLLDTSLTSRASSTGSATTENFVTTLRTTLDIGAVPSGPYQLAIRQTGQDWQLFPATVR
jgi:hypothetical protein